MRLRQALLMALAVVRANLLRSSLTMLGIVVGVSSVMIVLAIGSGAQTQVANQIRAIGANVLMVNPGTLRQGGARLKAGSRPSLTEGDVTAMIQQVSQVEAAAGSISGAAQVIRENKNWNTTINGTTSTHFAVRDWVLAKGRTFTASEEEGGGKVVVLGDVVARELFKDQDPLLAQVRILNVPFTVIGVLRPKGQDQDDVAFVPLSTAKLRFLGSGSTINRDAVAYIIVKASSDEAIPETESQLSSLLRQRHRLLDGQDDDFRITNPTEAMGVQQGTTQTIALLLIAIASVSLLVGGISIMNIMIVSVTERTREIGIRRAVGARQRDILVQFLSEALVLCLAGGLAGVCIGTAASYAIAMISGWPVVIEPTAVLLAISFSGVTGLVFGFYPARRAARLDPIEALRAD